MPSKREEFRDVVLESELQGQAEESFETDCAAALDALDGRRGHSRELGELLSRQALLDAVDAEPQG